MARYEAHVQETITVVDNAKAEVIHRIELSTDIPEYAKQAVKDFVAQAWDQLVSDTLSNIPDEITDYIDIVMEIVRSVMGG